LDFAAIAFFSEREIKVTTVVTNPIAFAEGGNRGGAIMMGRFNGNAKASHLNSKNFKFIM
jgi:hypothetical protein